MADIDYIYGYYAEVSPLRLRLALLNAGLALPEAGTACELGFGQGMSVNLHAAASATEWYGTDFNPAQAALAREVAQASGSGAKLYDEAFAEFCQRQELPDFDFIGLHGVWSWISDENRAIIVDFIRRKLKVGGVLYISYNTLPGWAAFAPMQHLFKVHADTVGAQGDGIINRVNGAVDFAERLLATNPAYARANPHIVWRIEAIKDLNRRYLAHEYFNRHWYPMHFAKMAEWLAPAKLSYACSAGYLDHVDVLNLTTEQQVFLNEIPDAMFRQSVRDFMVNEQFRKDYWVKGARRLTALEQAEAVRAQKVILTTPRADVSLNVTGALGEAAMSEAQFAPILDLLAGHKAHTVAQIEQVVREQGVTYTTLVQALMVLTGGGHLATVQDEGQIAQARKRTERLNAYLMDKARSSDNISFLASPVTGGGVALRHIEQLFLLAASQGQKPTEWAHCVWQLLASQGQQLDKDGKIVESADESLSELTTQAAMFQEKRMPALKALQIA